MRVGSPLNRGKFVWRPEIIIAGTVLYYWRHVIPSRVLRPTDTPEAGRRPTLQREVYHNQRYDGWRVSYD